MNPFNIEGRYPEMWGPIPSQKEADTLVQKNWRSIRMAEEAVITAVRKYLNELLRAGIPV